MSRSDRRSVLCSVCAACACAGSVRASIMSFWNQPAGGAFTHSVNWLDQAVPGVADEAHFRLGGAYTVSFTINVINAHAVVSNDHVVFQFDNTAYAIGGDPDSTLIVAGAPTDVASITVRGGRLQGTTVLIGAHADAHGAIVVEGMNARFAPISKLAVGDRGVGALMLRDGAVMTMIGADGGVSVGLAPGSEGLLRVEGGQTRMTLASLLVVGEGGSGRFEMSDGATATTPRGVIGGALGGTGEAALHGGATRWTVSGDLDVGLFDGNGALTLDAGAAVEAARVRIGANGSLGGHGVVRADVFSAGLIDANAAAALTIDGSLTLEASSTLRAALHGAELGAAVAVSGDTALDGALHVDFAGSHGAWTRGTVFDVLIGAGGVSEEFDAFTFTGLGGGLMAQVVYEADRVRVVVVPSQGGAAALFMLACVASRRRRG